MYPNLLGIGAAKAGTTWLYENLRRHPEVWLPPIKEINYFDHRVAGTTRFLPTRDYVQTLDTCAKQYPPHQMLTVFFDDIMAAPEQVLARLCQFLEIGASGASFSATANKKFNEGSRAAVPAKIARQVAERHYEELRELSRRFSGHTDRWLARARQILGAGA